LYFVVIGDSAWATHYAIESTYHVPKVANRREMESLCVLESYYTEYDEEWIGLNVLILVILVVDWLVFYV